MWKVEELEEQIKRFSAIVSKHFEFDSSFQAQAPTIPLGGLCEKKFESTNVVSSVVNMEGVKSLFLSVNYLRFRDHDLVGGFHDMWSMDLVMAILFKGKFKLILIINLLVI